MNRITYPSPEDGFSRRKEDEQECGCSISRIGFMNLTGSNIPDPLFPSVSLLVHFDNPNTGSTVFTDSSSAKRPVTSSGSITSDTSDKMFGVSCGNFSAVGSGYLTVPDSVDFAFGSGDFTIECWIKPTSLPPSGNYHGLIAQRNSSSSFFSFALLLNGDQSGGLSFEWSTTGTGSTGSISFGVPVVGLWQHVAVCRTGTSIVGYLNGVGGTAANIGTAVLADVSQVVALGVLSTGVGGYFNGKMDEARITKGYARYTSNFSPNRNSAFPNF